MTRDFAGFKQGGLATLPLNHTKMKVVIIGAGPAGLVTCKTLIESATPDFPFDPVILEQEADIGGRLASSVAAALPVPLTSLPQGHFDIGRMRYVTLGFFFRQVMMMMLRMPIWCHLSRLMTCPCEDYSMLRIR